MTREFNCQSCGCHVTAFGTIAAGFQDDLCAECRWLSEVTDDPQQREEIRKHMHRITKGASA